ncbi:hypothetical protein ACIO6T_40430 [Streptomyces sp. NPDC087532]|uniref:hypothetical protein n=1 Tax=unclassified Streptomyces TaxID=2593676 RepID=UPI0033270B70
MEQIARLARALMPAHLQPRRHAGSTAVAALPLALEDTDRYGPVASNSSSRAA